LVGRTDSKRSLGRSRRRGKNTIKRGDQEVGWEEMD
jgi:hypothetical protein